MCLDSSTLQRFKEPKNWIEGYKVLRWSKRGKVWRSQYSQQKWEFAELVKAKAPEATYFSGAGAAAYRTGIHAWDSLDEAVLHFDSYHRVVKVLLFGVTHFDGQVFRADAAIIIEALDPQGQREKW